jgi:hypothetical protein
MSKTTTTGAVILSALAIVLAACGGSDNGSSNPTPTPAATGGPANNTEAQCKQALREAFQAGLETPDGPSATPPAACVGLDEATLNRLVTEVFDEAFSESPSP